MPDTIVSLIVDERSDAMTLLIPLAHANKLDQICELMKGMSLPVQVFGDSVWSERLRQQLKKFDVKVV